MKKLLLLSMLVSSFANAQLSYPVAKKIPQVETRFGTQIDDPYKWMENPSDPDLWDWIEAQKELTANYLDTTLHETFAARALELRKIQQEQNEITSAAAQSAAQPGMPWDEADLASMGKKESRVIRWDSQLTGLKSTSPTKKESATYALSTKAVASGDLQRVLITQRSDNKLVDVLHVKFYTFVTWADDNSFYYVSDMDERTGGGRPALFRHTVGEVQSEDLVLLKGKTPSSFLTIHQVGERFFAEADGAIGALQLSTGRVSNPLRLEGDIVNMVDAPEVEASVLSFRRANFGEIQRLRLRDGQTRPLIGAQDFVLQKDRLLGEGTLLVTGLRDGAEVVGVFDEATQQLELLPLSDGTSGFVSFGDGVLKLTYETFAQPKKLYRYDLATKALTVLAEQKFPVEVEAEKLTYTASNGQAASMWVMKKKGLQLTKTTPTILFGYGGFRISITPSFGIYESLSWLERGGAYVVVTLPGSMDYGESWYQLARVGGRTHAWDSYALAAQELYRRGYTSKEHCGIMGASNGGTLTAGTLARHSDTFKATVPMVGVMDLLNFTLFTAGKYWTNDYGNPFSEADFRAMLPLSPYHNLQRREYPATMVMTAEFDDRVVPMHSYKYLARLQEYNTSTAPMLLYNKEWGAHGRTSGSARESSRYVAAYFTFFAMQLGL